MNIEQFNETADPAAVLGVAMSLHETLKSEGNVSEAYHGADEFMRQCMRVAVLFENWACSHVEFEALDDVWPYMLQDKFGPTFLRCYRFSDLAAITPNHCKWLAKEMGLALNEGI